ncbi:hypothetical protein CLV76_1262 [Marivita geojedonensis]|nr:hypothetical protein CLV76_1262 [Marivita geojedonensis]
MNTSLHVLLRRIVSWQTTSVPVEGMKKFKKLFWMPLANLTLWLRAIWIQKNLQFVHT